MWIRALMLLALMTLPACTAVPEAPAELQTINVPDSDAAEEAQPRFASVGRYTSRAATTGLVTDVFFPIDTDADERYPLAVYLQGANTDKDAYVTFASRISSYGFIVAVPNHEGLLGRFASLNSVDGTRTFVSRLSDDPDSPLFGRLDDTPLALLGHSFGGAAALDALRDECRFPFCSGGLERPVDLAAVSVYGSNLCESGDCSVSVGNDGIPVQLIQGALDGVAAPEEAERTFGQVASGPKQLVVVSGANHYSITDLDALDDDPDPNPPTLDPEVGIETAARWTGMFLRAYLLADGQAIDYITSNGELSDANVDARFVP